MQLTNLMTPKGRLIAASAITPAIMALIMLATHMTASAEASEEECPGGGYNPTPTAVTVDAVPIIVDSTAQEYFVLYVSHDVDSTEMELPVLVKKGQADTTTLAENVKNLPKEHYRVEKYLIADPADVDGDCTDDITELDNLGSMNPVNPAASVELTDGAVAIPDLETFETMSSRFNNNFFIKFVVLDMDSDLPRVYFINSANHPAHSTFLEGIGYEGDPNNVDAGNIAYDPELLAPDGGQGVFYYWPPPPGDSESVIRSHTQLAASMPLLEDNLALYIPNHLLRYSQSDLPLYRQSRISLVFDEDIYPETTFLSLNPAEGYGLLRAIEPDERPNHRDIVVYETLPNELPRVAGIISTVPQTPLSHVNLRAVQDGVPNAFIRDALEDDDINALIDGYVQYEVTELGYSLRAATKAEVDAHYESSRPTLPQTPQRDLSVTTINTLSDIGFDDWDTFGVKAANVAVLGTLDFPDDTVPDGFAIPFYFYDEFMKHNDFYTRIETMLADTDFQDDYDTQESELKDLRDDIEDAETPAWILTALADMNTKFPQGTTNRKYRSSTNNEDLPGFNGAGLYDSKSQKPDEDEEDGLDKSLKEVYASLWNFRAFTERDFHRIDHLTAAMGILVHPSYQDELVNGVAVSFNPTLSSTDSYYVNSQVDEDLVTNPDSNSLPEELLLSASGTYTVLATSNQIQRGQLLMTYAQITQLRTHLKVIHDHFAELYDPAADEQFAMEIEFKITSANVLAIKQARPWVFGRDTSQALPALSISDVEADEGSNVEFTVSMSQSATESVTVQYTTSDGTATSSDYTPVSGQTLTFAAGETEKTVSIATTDDSVIEQDESFHLALSNPSQNAELASFSTASGTIIDNDQPALSDDATLSALALADAGSTTVTLSQSFTSTTTTYTASVDNSVNSVTLTATKNQTGASVSIIRPNGATTPDTATVILDVGTNVITATVTAEDGTTTQTYVVIVTREASADATLSGLSLSGNAAAVLTPAFDPATTSYTADVADTVETISVTATANHAEASAAVMNTGGVSTPDTAEIDLAVGDNIISIAVTAEDGATTLTYQVTITRAFAWHTTLTVGEKLLVIPQASGYTTWGEDMGSLSTEHMELNGTRYRVLTLMRYAGGLYLNINRALPGDFTLTVGDLNRSQGETRIVLG